MKHPDSHAASRRGALAVLTALAFAPAAAAQSVWIVDPAPGPGVDFTEIQDAVDAAADGDVILVRSGEYESVTIADRSLVVQAEPGALVRISEPFGFGSIVVRDTGPGQAVTLRGIDAPFGSEGGLHQAGLVVSQCAGPVLVEDGDFSAINVGHPAGFAEGVRVEQSASVTLVRCSMVGLDAFPSGHFDPGLRTIDSDVQVLEGIATGTSGIEVQGGDVFVSGSTITGDVDALTIASGFRSTPAVTELANTYVPGAGGQDILLDAGTVTSLSGASRSYTHTSPVREGEATLETYAGAPFELAILALSPSLAPGVVVPGFFGSAHLGAPTFLRARGLLSADGTLTRSLVLGDLGPGTAAVQLIESAIFLDLVTAELRLANPSPVLLLDGGI